MFVPPNAGLGVKIGNTYVNGKSNKGKGKGKGTQGTSNSGEHQRQEHAEPPKAEDPLRRLAEALQAVTTPQRKPPSGTQTPSTCSEKNGSKMSDTSTNMSDSDKYKNGAENAEGDEGPDETRRPARDPRYGPAVRRDGAVRIRRRTIGQIVRNDKARLTADLHQLQPFRPAGDDATQREADGLAAIAAGVELGAVDECAAVVHGHR